MHLLHCLTFFEAKFFKRLIATHVAGMHNTLADDLSVIFLLAGSRYVSHWLM